MMGHQLFPQLPKDRPSLSKAAGNSASCAIDGSFSFTNCPVLLEYIWLGKAASNLQNMVMLGNVNPIPSDPENCPWAAQIDKYYARNPHLLPERLFKQTFQPTELKVNSWALQKKKTQVFLLIWSH